MCGSKNAVLLVETCYGEGILVLKLVVPIIKLVFKISFDV